MNIINKKINHRVNLRTTLLRSDKEFKFFCYSIINQSFNN